MNWYKKNQALIIGMLVGVGMALILGLVIWNSTQTKQNPKKASGFNTISDSSTGLSFNMSKKFEPISKEDLAKMNPGFSYGFKPADDPNTLCIVSQSKLTSGGTITTESLRDGVFSEIKKVHPDAAIANPKTVTNLAKFGKAQGILLEITYTDGATKVKRAEAIALGKAFQVIGYCQSAEVDNAKYYKDFTIFFSSLKLN